MKYTSVVHPSEPWTLIVRSQVETASDRPLQDAEVMLVDLHNELCRLRDEVVRIGHAEYYLDRDNNRQWRWKEVKP